MAHSVEDRTSSNTPEHIRRAELIRSERVRRVFPRREAQRFLMQKERRWAPIAYGIFAGAIVVIFCIAYITYAFSKYRGEILPGVRVDQVALSGLTPKQAAPVIDKAEGAIGQSPVRLIYGPDEWVPTPTQIGFHYQPNVTAQRAMDVGRTESFVVQLLDRLPIHPSHEVPLAYQLYPPNALRDYIQSQIAHNLNVLPTNAAIIRPPGQDTFIVRRSRSGIELDEAAAEHTVQSILGSLTKQTRTLKVDRTPPAITDIQAQRIVNRVDRFLSNTPVLGVGKRVIPTSAHPFVQMLNFTNVRERPGVWHIKMSVLSNVIQNYVASLASQIDRPATNARVQFSAGVVKVLTPRQTGRTLDQNAAYDAILKVVTSLTPRARILLSVATTQPPIDNTNPASLGITQLLGEGSTTFQGAGSIRSDGISQIAKSLDNTLISPTQDISFNTLVGTGWDNRVYDDREHEVAGQLVPGNHGAMQQVATTFLRALFAAGLKVEERHAHPYRLGWYEPPVGLDAVVQPGRNWDLRFANSTGKYLLIETRIEPIRQQLYIYVYGPKLGWKVAVDHAGKIVRTFPHAPAIRRTDSTLAPGAIRQTAWAHDGADTVVQRTITFPNGKKQVDELDTRYQPWQAIIAIGAAATAQPTPNPTSTAGASAVTPGPTPTPTLPQPTPSPTFSH